ncbi:O-fucosyltransferase family protein [Butyrivibrio sp. AE3006]|uniref:O-fucosyltransferase family protein n=1 Tax=Butyrivibrio sp. AE3006 TaxID=1280673 RepID=UPI0012DF415B|nr:O-fucosyltransferase family protein [Butyrivibrio sp. AE3006]
MGNEKKIGEYIPIHGNPDELHMEHRGDKHFGEVIYEIKEAGRGYGFFAEFKTLIENLAFADDYGFIPCVRYGQDYLYFEPSRLNENPFEYYFEPIGKEVAVDKAKNVIVSKPEYGQWIEFLEGVDGYHLTEKMIGRFTEIIKKYIRMKSDIQNDFDCNFEILKEKSKIANKKILGVHYRGTDFNAGYDKHPKNQKLDEIIKIVKETLDTTDMQGVFLATDDERALLAFQKEIGDKLSYCEDIMRSDGNVSIAFSEDNRSEHKYRLGLEVLRDAYFLSKCDGLICGVSQVATASQLLKYSRDEKFEFLYIFDLGMNNNLKKFNSKNKRR